MATIKVPLVEYGVARFAVRGQSESGDCHVVCCREKGMLIAVIDGIGHGVEAASAAAVAASVLKKCPDEPVISLIEQCHEELRPTRGVVLSAAAIDTSYGLITWLGVGNVEGVLMRSNGKKGILQERLLLRAGVVGSQLPPLQATVLTVARGDTLYFATDGIRSDFVASLAPLENPQRAADRILKQFQNGKDDALVLVARMTGIRP